MKLSRLSNSQLRRLLRDGEVRFGNNIYLQKAKEAELEAHKILDSITKMEIILTKIWADSNDKELQKRLFQQMAKLSKLRFDYKEAKAIFQEVAKLINNKM